MTVNQLQSLRNVGFSGTDRARDLPQPRNTNEPGDSDAAGFGETLRQAIQEVDQAQKTANEQMTAFVAGKQENVHDVMIAANQAKLAFHLMTEVRNRMLETYQELMRTQV